MKKEKSNEVVELVESFCKLYLNDELSVCSLRLCDKLSRSRKLDITRGKKEIWAASIVYVIARVNFLFDKEGNTFLTSDIICDFFGTKKTTTANKATSIEQAFNIGIGDENYCTSEIIESFSFVQLPGGFIVTEKMANEMISKAIDKVVVKIASKEKSPELEEFMAEKKRQGAEAEQGRKERQAELNREIAEKKRQKKEAEQAKLNKRQLNLW
jgi:hypothetical protein